MSGRSKKARLMLWKSSSGSWVLSLWIPFHGQWPLVRDDSRDKLLIKTRRMARLLPSIEIEAQDS